MKEFVLIYMILCDSGREILKLDKWNGPKDTCMLKHTELKNSPKLLEMYRNLISILQHFNCQTDV